MKVAIIGAGLSGLTAAYELLKMGVKVEVFEKEKQVGGFARSINMNGYIFDIGPHIFHTRIKVIRDLVEVLLREDLILRHFYGKIWLEGELYDYPPTLWNIFKLTLPKSLKALWDYASVWMDNKNKNEYPELSLEDWMVSLAGETLYKTYFSDYTEKLWGIHPSHLTADWAPERISIRFLSRSFFGDEWQVYPRFGIGMITNRLAEIISKKGGRIRTGTKIVDLITSDGAIKNLIFTEGSRTGKASYDAIISTIPITKLSRLLKSGNLKLKFRSVICAFLVVKEPHILNGTHWIYFPSKEFIFTRIYEPKNFSAFTVPSSTTSSICAESVCDFGDKVWKMSEKELVDIVTAQLSKCNMLRKERIVKASSVHMRYAYPVNEFGYKNELERFKSALHKYRNLIVAGRFGDFLYMNMDAAMQDGMNAAKQVYSIRKKAQLKTSKDIAG